MIFNSFQFIWLFPLIFLAYWGCSLLAKGESLRRLSNGLLLVVSYLLYMQWCPAYALLLLGVTAVTFLSALLIEKRHAYGRKKYIILSGATLALLPLLVFKYYNFLNESVVSVLGIGGGLPGLNWAIPVGISFFSFIAVGYLFDVYYQRIRAEHSWWDYMLFVSFFPQIMSGPISKAKDLLPQIKSVRLFSYDRAVEGMRWLLWGMFMKVILADNIGLFVDKSLPAYMYQSGTTTLFTAVLYSFQIYGDFAGYSFMAIGVGRLLGFDLVNNFRRPYLSTSVTDFWRRWHISLSTWLKDYVYIPMGGSRCSKWRCYWNIIVTFLVSGIWHGANWTFIVWGLFHGACQVVEKWLGLQKCETTKPYVRAARIMVTFALVTIAWVFFRMPTLADGWGVLSNMLTGGSLDLSYADNKWKLVVGLSLAILVVKELCEEYFPRVTLFEHRRMLVRWVSYVVLILFIMLCGIMDAGQFIYVSF